MFIFFVYYRVSLLLNHDFASPLLQNGALYKLSAQIQADNRNVFVFSKRDTSCKFYSFIFLRIKYPGKQSFCVVMIDTFALLFQQHDD